MLRKVVADLGNSLWKIKVGDKECSVPNALVEIGATKFEQARRMRGGTLPSDYVIVNDRYYVIGKEAENYGLVKSPTGDAKYTEDYYGVALAAMSAQVIRSNCEVVCYLAYPPGNIHQVDALMNSVLSAYDITVEGKSFKIKPEWTYVYVEPVGGVMNILLTKEGVLRQAHNLKNGRILAVDFGGGTTDFSAISPDGELDPSIQYSILSGINDIYSILEIELKDKYSSEFKGGHVLPQKLRYALKNNTYNLKGSERDCADIVSKAKQQYLNDFSRGFHGKAAGGTTVDFIVLTGAGYVDIFDDILSVMGFEGEAVFKAEDDEFAHYANVRGADKQLTMFEKTGIISYE